MKVLLVSCYLLLASFGHSTNETFDVPDTYAEGFLPLLLHLFCQLNSRYTYCVSLGTALR